MHAGSAGFEGYWLVKKTVYCLKMYICLIKIKIGLSTTIILH